MTSRFYLAGLVLVAMLVIVPNYVRGIECIDACCCSEKSECYAECMAYCHSDDLSIDQLLYDYQVCVIDATERKAVESQEEDDDD